VPPVVWGRKREVSLLVEKTPRFEQEGKIRYYTYLEPWKVTGAVVKEVGVEQRGQTPS
jgi:hypothetical protein